MPDVSEIAARLDKARVARSPIGSFATEFPDLDLAAAYEAQALARAAAGTLVGWKLGVTSRAKQAQVGVDAPIRGFLAAEHVLDWGEPLAAADYIQPRVEPEIAFVMARELTGSHVTAAQVIAATAAVAPGIEVLDSRYTDYKFTMPDVVADNASAARFVIGTPVPVTGLDLRLVGVLLEINGEVVATASGAASLGNPAAAVAWLVRSLAAEGLGLRAGDVIISGGLTAARNVTAGDSAVVTIDRLGSVELAVR